MEKFFGIGYAFIKLWVMFCVFFVSLKLTELMFIDLGWTDAAEYFLWPILFIMIGDTVYDVIKLSRKKKELNKMREILENIKSVEKCDSTQK